MRLQFFVEYVKNIRTVGAVTSSSKYLASQMMHPINFDTAKVIVQYGPGAGSFTDALLERRNSSTALVLIELNETFYRSLLRKYADCDNIYIHNGSAADIVDVLNLYGLPDHVEYIVSGLPFASLPKKVSESIITSTMQVLQSKGVFITFQYTLLKKSFFDATFARISIVREWRNIPPAYVLVCRK